MKCSQCGHEVNDNALFCTNCGHKLQSTALPESDQEEIKRGGTADEKGGRSNNLAVVAIAALVVLIIAGISALAVYRGMQDRDQNEARLAEEHFVQGENHLEQGDLELAVAEFERALVLKPDHRQAREQLAKAREMIEGRATATPALQQETAAVHWNALSEAYQRDDYEAVLAQAEKLLAVDPSYNRDSVDQMLFEAFYELGQQRVAEDRMEEALRYFDRALTLREDEAVAEAQQLATWYLSGMSYWAANWEEAIGYFSQVYDRNPDYKDVAERLADAYINHARLLADDGEWCDAAEAYASAQDVVDRGDVESEYESVRERCEQGADASPSPDETEDSEDQTPTGPAGEFVGTFVREEPIDSQKIFFRGRVYDKEEEPMSQVVVQVQAWDWTATAITDGDGQYSFDGLTHPTTYRLSVLNYPGEPFEVEGEPARLKWVDFYEMP